MTTTDPRRQPDRAPARAHEEGRRRVQRPRLRHGGHCPPPGHGRVHPRPRRAGLREGSARRGDAAVSANLPRRPRAYIPYPIQFGSGDWITVVTRVTGTFTGPMTLPDGKVLAPTGKAFDVEFGQTVKWDGDKLIQISAFWVAALQGSADRPRPEVKGHGRLVATGFREPAGEAPRIIAADRCGALPARPRVAMLAAWTQRQHHRAPGPACRRTARRDNREGTGTGDEPDRRAWHRDR